MKNLEHRNKNIQELSLDECDDCKSHPRCVRRGLCQRKNDDGIAIIKIPQEEADRVNRMYDSQNAAYFSLESKNYKKAISNFIETISLRQKSLPPIEEDFAATYPYLITPYSISVNKGAQLEDLLHLGIAFREVGNYDRACQIFKDLIEFSQTLGREIYPHYIEEVVFYLHNNSKEHFLTQVWTELGKVYINMELFDKALEVYTTSLNPKEYEYVPWVALAVIYKNLEDQKKFKKAKHFYIKEAKKFRFTLKHRRIAGWVESIFGINNHKTAIEKREQRIRKNKKLILKVISNGNNC